MATARATSFTRAVRRATARKPRSARHLTVGSVNSRIRCASTIRALRTRTSAAGGDLAKLPDLGEALEVQRHLAHRARMRLGDERGRDHLQHAGTQHRGLDEDDPQRLCLRRARRQQDLELVRVGVTIELAGERPELREQRRVVGRIVDRHDADLDLAADLHAMSAARACVRASPFGTVTRRVAGTGRRLVEHASTGPADSLAPRARAGCLGAGPSSPIRAASRHRACPS